MRKFIAFFILIIFVQYSSSAQGNKIFNTPVKLNDGIETTTFKLAGLNEKTIKAMDDSISNGNYTNIHSVLIFRDNKLLYEKYWRGNDAVRGKGSVGMVDHHRDSLHDVRSVTKSVVSAAVMIAVAQGKIKSLNQRVFDFFPGYAKEDTGMKKQITIQHVLNMTAGFDWNEYMSYTDPKNSEVRMNNSANAIEFVLSLPLVDTPGKQFNYSGGCSQLLAEIIQKATGMPVDKFTNEYLFQPLGISNFNWVKISDGRPSAASGLRLRSRDMAKFGLLFMNDGKWKGRQIIPALLVTQTLKSQVIVPGGSPEYPPVGYSNQFWNYTEIINGDTVNYAQCLGNGGQMIVQHKQSGLLLIITAGNYNAPGIRKGSWDIFPDFVYPAIIK